MVRVGCSALLNIKRFAIGLQSLFAVDFAFRRALRYVRRQAAGAATISGLFLNTIINLLIVACVIFVLVNQVNRPVEASPSPCGSSV